ncbi:MAG: hypothetical protein LUI85_17025 [Bacteroides sp.]|nr:hypothetical protein [Bacteroides sp.]
MKKKNIIFTVWCVCFAMSVAAQDCEISLTVARAAQKEVLPSQVQEILGNRLSTAVAGQGVIANSNFTPFFITAKVNTLYKETLPGPPVSTALTTQLTLYIGDAIGQKVFSTLSMDVKGVGTNINRAYINAFRAINGNNIKVQEFIREGKEKIISWYNSNYKQILAKAQKSASMHEYDAALYYVTSIPECCVGYTDASKLVESYYAKYVNYNCQLILQYARAEWAKSPDAEGASKAFDWLVYIEPGSSCEGEAKALYNEIKTKVTSDWNFENREKYKDDIELKKQRIEAARAVGVAFGNGQQPVTTNITWLH